MEKILDLKKLESNDSKVKFAFVKELLQLSVSSPNEVYPYFEKLIPLLDDENNLIKCTSIDIIGNLSRADIDNKINNAVMDKIIDLFYNDKLVTCNHAIYALGLIAESKPAYKDLIIQKLLKVQDNDFETDECEAIATGKVLDALNPFFDELKENKSFVDFVKFATKSSRNSTKNKAEELLKRIS